MTSKIDIPKFQAWLLVNGAEIIPVTNEHESIRFKGREIGVLYKSGKTSNMYTATAVSYFIRNKKWDGKPVNVGRNKSYVKEKASLLERDGCNCFLCDEPLNEDITVEHLIALVAGGSNSLANMVLVHENCNYELGNLPIYAKVQMAIEYRIKKLVITQ